MTTWRSISLRVRGKKYFCIATSNADGVTHFALSGRLVAGPEGAVGSLHDTVSRAVRQNTREIVIDLGEIEQIDAAGIGELVFNYSIARSAGMTLILENPRPFIRILLETCRLDMLLLRKPSEVEVAYAAAQ